MLVGPGTSYFSLGVIVGLTSCYVLTALRDHLASVNSLSVEVPVKRGSISLPRGSDVFAVQATSRETHLDEHPLVHVEPKVTVVVAMVETRFCEPAQKNPRWKRDYNAKRLMRRRAAALNLHYAQRHGYEFRLYCKGETRGFATAWLKVRVLEELFLEASKRSTPTYILLVDSDVYVRAMDTGLPAWMAKNGVPIAEKPWSIMYAAESDVKPKFTATHLKGFTVNTGVAYGYADPGNRNRMKAAIDALQLWQSSLCNVCDQYQTDDKHPWEQGCLEVLLAQSELFQSVVNVSHQHMNLWNGPWGQFARHAWGGPGKELRKWVFEDEVLSHQVDVDTACAQILANHLGPNVTFHHPKCLPKPTEMKRNTN